MPLSMEVFMKVPQVDQSEASTSSDEIASRFKDQITDKTILITGVSPGGIGAAAALSLATGSPNLIILAGRDLEKVNQTIDDVRKVNSNVEIRALELDLASLAKVTKAAESLDDIPSIDILINNAGVMACPYSKTEDGIEYQFGTNYLGHFQLTRLLLPKFQASKEGGRVVNLSSISHWLAQRGIRFEDDVNFHEGKDYDKWDAYAQSKTALVLMAVELKRRGLVGKAFAVHPGNVGTHLLRYEEVLKDIVALGGGAKVPVKSPKQGASTVLWAALDPSLDEFAYLADCQVTEPAEYASDPADAERLWKLSEEMVDDKLALSSAA